MRSWQSTILLEEVRLNIVNPVFPRKPEPCIEQIRWQYFGNFATFLTAGEFASEEYALQKELATQLNDAKARRFPVVPARGI